MILIHALSELGRDDVELAGGKGANLGELVRAGFPVPDGFVVSTHAYSAAISALDLQITRRLAAGRADLIRADIESVAIAAELRSQIIEAYTGLGSGPVAVRSSATAEDLPSAAFAGQQDTFLNVIGIEELITTIRRCWASLWSDRATSYRARLGLDEATVRIAVVVQGMVDAEVAGVLFTADPVSGDRDTVVVDASTGLGEAVVSGLVTPDHYLVAPDGQVREFHPGRPDLIVRAAAGGGVRHERGRLEESTRLPEPAVAVLAGLGVSAARLFDRPQDIEWAYADGRFWLLQARPMTALPPPPLRLNAAQRRLGSIVLDYLPVRPYPIDMTTWVPHGPVGLMADVVARFGIDDAFDGLLHEDEYGVVDRLVPHTPRPTIGVLLAPWRIISLARRHDPEVWTEDPRFVRFLAAVERLAAHDLTTMSWRALRMVPRQALDLIRPIGELRIDYLPGTGLSLLRLRVLVQLLGRPSLFPRLLVGRTRTADANDALEALAAVVREDPALAAAVRTGDPKALTVFDDFRSAFDAYLTEYGHRETVSPVLVSTPTQQEDPATVLALIEMLAAKSPGPRPEIARAEAELVRHPLLRGPRGHARVRRWVAAARAGVAFREDSHFYFLKPLPILRRALLEIGRRLQVGGVLAEPEDVFHLRLEELESVDDPVGAAAAGKLTAVVRRRAARRQELAGVRLIDAATVFPLRDRGNALLVGTPASSGRATGPVKIIREPADFGRLVAGDVLVCPYTNPAWTPLFQRAAAVVVDSGGPASHAAIVAREYAIPAVMGTGSGSAVLNEGLLVTVDGSSGRVSAAESGS